MDIRDVACFEDKAVFIKGGVNYWRFFDKDVPSLLKERFPNSLIYQENDIDGVSKNAQPIDSFIDSFTVNDDVASWSWQPFLEFQADHDLYDLPTSIQCDSVSDNLLAKSLLSPWVVFSSRNMTCSLHVDIFDLPGVIAQLHGDKKFTLVKPNNLNFESKYYEEDEFREMGVDYEVYYLEAGDFLYFPPNWYHQAKTVDKSVTFVHTPLKSSNINVFLSSVLVNLPDAVKES